MKHLIRKNKYFFIPYLFFFAAGIILLLSYSRPELHILSNKTHHPFFDQFFKYATYLGDGLMVAVITVVLLFVRFRYAIAFLIGSLSASGLVQLFKKVLLEDMYRPSKYFEMNESYTLRLIEGVNLHSLHSFPSGHSTTAFNVFMMLSIVVKNRLLKVLSLLLAVTVAYSRVYLSQHFLIDITVGSVVGIVFILLAVWWSETWNKNWLDKSVLTVSQPSNDK
ncbi:MAG: phosphatase PAP2 family protein [Prolixibacteraceae bacterium]